MISFLIKGAYKSGDQMLDENEEVVVRTYTFDEMEDMMANREIQQLFTITAYHLAKNFLFRK